MPVVECPIPGCTYKTPELDNVVVAALITAHSMTHSNKSDASVARVEKVKRPSISLAGTTEDCLYFKERWAEYVVATKISGKELSIQLLDCCEEKLRRDLTRSSAGSLMEKSEEDLLIDIRKLAVREENVMVSCATLRNMRQDREETIQSFLARLKGQANICKFLVTCSKCDSEINYVNEILKDTLIHGMEDSVIRLEILGHENQNFDLITLTKFIEARESVKRSAMRLSIPQNVDHIKSSYSKNKRENVKGLNTNTADKSTCCTYCGLKGHGSHPSIDVRKERCPAFD